MASEKQIAANRKNAKKAGRKKGSLSQTTIDKNASLKAYQQKAMAAADVLFNNQMHLAKGVNYLYKIEKKVISNSKKTGKVYGPMKPKRVTCPHEIEKYLMEEVIAGDVDDDKDPNATYYFITTEKGDNRANDSLLDRAYGKATNVIATEDEDGKRKEISANVITFASQDDN